MEWCKLNQELFYQVVVLYFHIRNKFGGEGVYILVMFCTGIDIWNFEHWPCSHFALFKWFLNTNYDIFIDFCNRGYVVKRGSMGHIVRLILDIIIPMLSYCPLRMGFHEENDCMAEMNNGLLFKTLRIMKMLYEIK